MRAFLAVLWPLAVGCGPTTAKPQDDDGDGYDEPAGDCNDADATVYPDAPEHCDGRDENCDGEVDEDPVDAVPVYVDADGDGVVGQTAVTACDAGPDQSDEPGDDCDDADPAVHPGATERCNTGIDEDCDGAADGCAPTGELDVSGSEVALLGGGLYQWGSALAAVGDADGDGGADLAVGLSTAALGSGDPGGIYILPIATDGTVRQIEAVGAIEGINPWAVPAHVAGAADVDGDGSRDLLVGSPGGWEGEGTFASAQLYLGPLDDTRDADAADTFFRGGTEDGLGSAVAMVPDADGDGLAEVAVGAPWTGYDTSAGHDPGHVYVWFSPVAAGERSPADADLVIEGYHSGSHLGEPLVGLADVDGDGRGDLAAGALYDATGGGAGTVYVFSGLGPGAWGVGEARATLYWSDSWSSCARTLSAWSDGVAVGCAGQRRVWTIRGADAAGYREVEESWAGWIAAPEEEGEFPTQLADGGDIDGDGAPDLLANALGNGSAWIFYGNGEQLHVSSPMGKQSQVGWSLLATDGDGDGYDDAWFGDPTVNTVWGVRGGGL